MVHQRNRTAPRFCWITSGSQPDQDLTAALLGRVRWCSSRLCTCNDLWLQLMTVSLCDGLIRRMYVERERENSAHERGRAYFARPSRVSQLSLALGHVSLRVTTSHHLLISSVFVYVDRFILRCEYNYASRLRRVITVLSSVNARNCRCLHRGRRPGAFKSARSLSSHLDKENR